jgi:hypothetical protein
LSDSLPKRSKKRSPRSSISSPAAHKKTGRHIIVYTDRATATPSLPLLRTARLPRASRLTSMLGLVATPPAAAAPSRTRCSAATPTERTGRASLAIPAAASLSLVLWSSPGTVHEHCRALQLPYLLAAKLFFMGVAVNAGILSGFSGLESVPGPDLPRVEFLERWNGQLLSHSVQFIQTPCTFVSQMLTSASVL